MPDAVEDAAPVPDAVEDVGPAPDAAPDVNPDKDFGFALRVPESHHLVCEQSGPFAEEMDVLDTDWMCTFAYGNEAGYIYVQNTPLSCITMMSSVPSFESEGWISLDGEVSPLEEPLYDYGGNHNNDWLEFTWQGSRYKLYHSSFGFGWRKCQPMDCVQVLDGPDGTVVEDGCVPKERSLPVVCVQVAEDGTYPPLVDTFEPCNGDDDWD